jgi:hypothetical protein
MADALLGVLIALWLIGIVGGMTWAFHLRKAG